MVSPAQRTPEAFEKSITAWIAGKLPGIRNVRVIEQSRPQGVGNANETIITQLAWEQNGQPGGADYVVRIAPTGFQLMKDPRFAETARLQQALAEFGRFPVPAVLWYEDDPGILGSPFCVMSRVTGRAPTDNPSYNRPETWVGQLTPEERRTLWLNGIRNLAAIHTAKDLDKRVSPLLRQPPPGLSGLEYELQYWEDFHVWAGWGMAHPVTLAARNWLKDNFPHPHHSGFAWGDARIENMLFDDQLNCIAVLDWELACLGGPMFDLGWWLHMDRVGTFAAGQHGRATGLGTREETLALWRELTGIPTDNVEWFEILAAYRLVAFFSSYFRLETETGFSMAGMSMLNNFAVSLLAPLLGITDLGAYDALVAFPA